MVAPLRPTGSKALQNTKWAFVPTIASQGAPTVAEVTAASALDISCYLYDTSDRPTINQNRVTPPARICDGAIYEALGLATVTGGTLHAAFDPQAAAASTGKKAWEKLTSGATGYLVRRSGMSYLTDFATGQFVDVFPVQFGQPFPTTEGDAEAAENSFDANFGITGPPSYNVAVV